MAPIIAEPFIDQNSIRGSSQETRELQPAEPRGTAQRMIYRRRDASCESFAEGKLIVSPPSQIFGQGHVQPRLRVFGLISAPSNK
jgi:hypothetical protein